MPRRSRTGTLFQGRGLAPHGGAQACHLLRACRPAVRDRLGGRVCRRARSLYCDGHAICSPLVCSRTISCAARKLLDRSGAHPPSLAWGLALCFVYLPSTEAPGL
eukprot:6992935-Pyramimonas_sp.AAC.1